MTTEKKSSSSRESFSHISFQDLVKTPIEVEWIIEGMISKGDSTLIHAPGGVGKSMLALYISLFLASHGTVDQGTPGLVFDKFPVPKESCSLFIQAENSHAAMYSRITAMCKGDQTLENGLNRVFTLCKHEDTTITGERFSDKEFCDFLVGYISKLENEQGLKIDLLIIDPLISYHGGNENDSVESRTTLDGITEVCSKAKCTPILIHHARKAGGEYRGSTAINDWTRNRISLKQENRTKAIIGKNSRGKTELVRKPVNQIWVTHEKCNNFEMFESFLLEMGADLNFRLAEEHMKPKDAEICQKVVQALEGMGGHAESKNALAKAYKATFKVAEKTAKRHIEKAEERGFISKESTTRDGKETHEYSLPEK